MVLYRTLRFYVCNAVLWDMKELHIKSGNLKCDRNGDRYCSAPNIYKSSLSMFCTKKVQIFWQGKRGISFTECLKND